MQTYFRNLEREVSTHGVPARVPVDQIEAGVMTAGSAGQAPVQTLLSGPASGVIGRSMLAGWRAWQSPADLRHGRHERGHRRDRRPDWAFYD